MEPGGRLAGDLEIGLAQTEGGEHRDGVGLHGGPIGLRCRAGPMPARAGKRRLSEAHARGGHILVFRRRAAIGLPQLEQRPVGEAPVAIALGRGDEPRQQRGAHLGKFRGDRVVERQFRLTAAEQLRFGEWHEGPRHRFHQAARGERAPCEPLPCLALGEHGGRDPGEPCERRGRYAVDAGEPHHLFHEIDGGGDVRTPRRRDRLQHVGLALELDAECCEFAADVPMWQRQPAQAADHGHVEFERWRRLRRLAGDRDLARAAAAQVEHHLRGELQARQHELRIDAALEAETRVGLDIQRAAGARRALRIEIGRTR